MNSCKACRRSVLTIVSAATIAACLLLSAAPALRRADPAGHTPNGDTRIAAPRRSANADQLVAGWR